jgi:hypothetical protein
MTEAAKTPARIELTVRQLLTGQNELFPVFKALNQAKGLTGMANYKITKNTKEIDAVCGEQREVFKKLIKDAEIKEPDIRSLQKKLAEVPKDDAKAAEDLAKQIIAEKQAYESALENNEIIKTFLDSKVPIDFPKKITPAELEALEYDAENKKYFSVCCITSSQMHSIFELIDGGE